MANRARFVLVERLPEVARGRDALPQPGLLAGRQAGQDGGGRGLQMGGGGRRLWGSGVCGNGGRLVFSADADRDAELLLGIAASAASMSASTPSMSNEMRTKAV